ncbi:Spy/CpxP family protein refolding chaperone [Methylophaga sp.]|uniref:Spy/CpxP family protein refolding chaperone n=1 Tax=Methylophaga sp. TaxID=2024840 RepID=UPI0025E64965|nr:Spy/CpxP family protein refolding chaperone [Methylophaga sp.]
MRSKLMALSLIPALFLAVPAMADKHKSCDEGQKYGEMKKKHKDHDGIPRILQGVDLTEAQKSEIKELVEAQQTDKRNDMKSHWELHKQLNQLAFNDRLDQNKLEAIINEATESHADRLAKKAKLNNAIFNVLTAEQKQQLQQKMAESENRNKP